MEESMRGPAFREVMPSDLQQLQKAFSSMQRLFVST